MNGSLIKIIVSVSALALAIVSFEATTAPTIDPKTDAQHFGRSEDELFWTPEQKVAGFRNMDKIGPAREVAANGQAWPLPIGNSDLSEISIDNEGNTLSLNQYIERQDVAGLLVIKNGKVAYEHYALGNTSSTRWISYSVAKSVTSLLVVAAIRDGYIQSVDEKVTDYLPRLKGSAYDAVSIRNLLQMSSGVAWDESYSDRKADINRILWPSLEAYRYLRELPIAAEPGKRFNYNTAETNLVGDLLRAAIGNNLSTYLSDKIWTPFGMGADAYWTLTHAGGGELGGSSLNATLRDYGRIGLFVLNNGRLADGTQVLPDGWIEESTTPSAPYPGYGYLWWRSSDKAAFQALGIFGQAIYINPAENLIIALHSAWPIAYDQAHGDLRNAMFRSVMEALKDQAPGIARPDESSSRNQAPALHTHD